MPHLNLNQAVNITTLDATQGGDHYTLSGPQEPTHVNNILAMGIAAAVSVLLVSGAIGVTWGKRWRVQRQKGKAVLAGRGDGAV
jgi:hypothetical protein